MPEIVYTKDINSSPETVFDLIADLPNYDKWLPPSNLYNSVTEYTDLPVHVGTSYVDQGKTLRMVGGVTEFDRPKRIGFRQVTTSIFGELAVEIRYTVEAMGSGSRLTRQVNVTTSGGYRIIQMYLMGTIRKEVERILEQIKTYLEERS